MQTLATIALVILLPGALIVGLIVGYTAWRNRRRAEDTQVEAQGGSGGGPKEPA